MKKRKLITSKCFNAIGTKVQLGVPLARIMRDLDIDDKLSRPAAAKLMRWHEDTIKSELSNAHTSLNPEWLDQDGAHVQEQPDNWKYIGYFPLGEWVNENN